MAPNGVALYRPPYLSKHYVHTPASATLPHLNSNMIQLYETINPQLQHRIPGPRSFQSLNTAYSSTDAVAAVVADMRNTKPELCASILSEFDLRHIFVPDMLNGVDHYFLRLVATQIALENLASLNYRLAAELTGAKDLMGRQLEVIAHQHRTIIQQGLSTSPQGDNIHLAGEAWGYGHAETAGPRLLYNPGPKSPVISTATEYKHERLGQKAVVAVPLKANGGK